MDFSYYRGYFYYVKMTGFPRDLCHAGPNGATHPTSRKKYMTCLKAVLALRGPARPPVDVTVRCRPDQLFLRLDFFLTGNFR